MSIFRSATICIFVTASLGLAGCVSQEKYDALEKQNTELREANRDLTESSLFLSGELLEADQEMQTLERQQEALQDEVDRWAAIGAVHMELLRSGLRIVLPNEILFTSGSAKLKPEGENLIKELVGALEDIPYQILVVGNTDNVAIGPELAKLYPSNWELAGARASSVVRVMAAEGVPAQQLLAVSMGDTRPVAPNDTAEGRRQNRRIEVRIRPVVVE